MWSSRDGHVSSGRDGRASSGSTYLLSRTKRQTAHHELLNSAMGEHIIFTESPAAPGVPIVFRLPEERMKNPERLNLDRSAILLSAFCELSAFWSNKLTNPKDCKVISKFKRF